MSLPDKSRVCMRKNHGNTSASGFEKFHDSTRRKDDLLTIFRKDAAHGHNTSFEYSTKNKFHASMKRQSLMHASRL